MSKKLVLLLGLACFALNCVGEPAGDRVLNWKYIESNQTEMPANDDSRWQPYQKTTEFNGTVWFLVNVKQSETYRFLFIPHLTLHGLVEIYYKKDLVYKTTHDPSVSDYEFAEAVMDVVIPRLIPVGKMTEPDLFLRIQPIEGYPVSVTKDLEIIDEGDYLRLLLRYNADIFFVASVLLFIAILSLIVAYSFRPERNRILALAGLNIVGAITLTAGTPYIWTAFSQSYASVRLVMVVQLFIPVFVFWFFFIDARIYRRLIGGILFLHIALALISTPVILMSGMLGNTVTDANMGVFFVSQLLLLYVIFKEYFFRDKRSKLVAFGALGMMLFSLNDMFKAFGITMLTERPTYHWGLLIVSLVMLYVVYLEFVERGEVIKKNLDEFKELAFITSHKLRHPIANMIGLVQVLEDHDLEESEKKNWIDMITLTSKQLDAMVHRMSELTVIETFEMKTNRSVARQITEAILIDDDRINNVINERFIGYHVPGVKVTVFQDARKALEYVKNHDSLETTIIFLDINMDDMNGFEFLDSVSDFKDQLMVYMLSSSIDDSDVQKSYSYHCVYEYITKPLKKKDLVVFQTEQELNNS